MSDLLPPLEAAYRKTTQGEWQFVEDAGDSFVHIPDGPYIIDSGEANDIEWCAAVHNAWPALRQRVERLEEQLDGAGRLVAALLSVWDPEWEPGKSLHAEAQTWLRAALGETGHE